MGLKLILYNIWQALTRDIGIRCEQIFDALGDQLRLCPPNDDHYWHKHLHISGCHPSLYLGKELEEAYEELVCSQAITIYYDGGLYSFLDRGIGYDFLCL